MAFRSALWTLLAVALAAPSAAQTTAPLPKLTLEAYPPSARAALGDVYRAAVAEPDNADAVGALAKRLHAWEVWGPAHDVYARARALAPASFDWHYLDAVVLQRLARQPDAIDLFRKALVLTPEYLPARVKLAEALLEAGQIDESEQLFEALVREPAAEPAAQVGLGRIAAARGKHDAAIAHFDRAIVLFPELGAAHYGLALSYRAAGRRDAGRDALARHKQYGPLWPRIDDPVLAAVVSLKDDATAQMRRGIALADSGDVEGAIAALEGALARDGSLVTAHATLISLYGRTRNWARGQEHYEAVVASGAELGDAHFDYGVLLGLHEKWDLAAETYRKAIAVNPAHAQARNNLGQILERDRRFEEAAAEYRQAVASQPAFRLARFNLGRMLIALGRPEEAVVELQKLTEPRDAESPRYLFGLATAHVRAGRKDEGIKWASEAKRLAEEYGQHDLARAIEQNLALLK
ncbi:MAG TPA: tetratricopeptide repeat protein [Vicinamibacterales bacterium]|jgi:tetratricopeptide (TPR) repeat protein|nr:tetratricopeptide repeat protein [Vicinamibacterales bacterium]